MRKLFLLLFIVLIGNVVYAQLDNTERLKKQLESNNKDTVAWVYGGTLLTGLNQGFLHNWPAGGEIASLTVNGIFSGFVNRLYHNHIWSNNLDMNYSLFYAYSNEFVPRKLEDRIDFTSKYGMRWDTASEFYLTALFNFKSQFSNGYDYNLPRWDTLTTSEFLSPAYFILAAGMEYRKGSDLTLFLSPVAARVTYADEKYTLRNPEGAFGIENGKNMRFELGAYFSGRYKVDITPKMMYKTRLDLYSNYLAKDKKDSTGAVVKTDNPGNIDIFWDNLFTWKMGKHVGLIFGATLIYDNDIPYEKTYVDETGAIVPKNEPGTGLGWVQMKQLFTLGFEYKF